MASPFVYPKVKHHRTQNPPAYKDYKSYKPFLQIEFERQCVYCRALERIKGKEAFGADHYRPKKHFPHLETEYLNLFYCCNRCNSLKRSFWPSPAQVSAKQFVPNPCEHVMFEHLRYRGGSVAPASEAGDWTIDLLDLNDPDAVGFREALIKIIDSLQAQIRASAKTVEDIKRLYAKTSDAPEKDRIARELDRAKRNLDELTGTLKQLIG